MKAKAEAGDAEAQYLVGQQQERAVELFPANKEKILAKAVEWYQKSADQGYAPAQEALALFYLYGDGGLTQNSQKGINLLRESGKNGNPDAHFTLGLIYEDGIKGYLGKNSTESLKWYRMAAQSEHIGAQYKLGHNFLYGKGAPSDLEEAMMWFKKAADNGNLMAMTELAVLYEDGIGVPKDRVEATRLFKVVEKAKSDNANEHLTVLRRARGYAVGDDDAPNHLEVYFSPGCGTCLDFFDRQLGVLKQNIDRGRVRVSFIDISIIQISKNPKIARALTNVSMAVDCVAHDREKGRYTSALQSFMTYLRKVSPPPKEGKYQDSNEMWQNWMGFRPPFLEAKELTLENIGPQYASSEKVDFEKCWNEQSPLYQKVQTARIERMKLRLTADSQVAPKVGMLTFVLNGRKISEEFDPAIFDD